MGDGSTPPPSPLGDATREEVLEEVEKYITRINNTVVQYISTWPILELCEEAELRMGARASKKWREKEGINFIRAQAEIAIKSDMEGKKVYWLKTETMEIT